MKALEYKKVDYKLSAIEKSITPGIYVALTKTLPVAPMGEKLKSKIWKITKFILSNDIGCPLYYITNGTFFESFESAIASEGLTNSWHLYYSMREEFPRHIVQKDFLRFIYENKKQVNNIIFNITEDKENDFIFIF